MSEVDKGALERRRYIEAFNDTMVRIWREKVISLHAVDTGALLSSIEGVSAIGAGKYIDVILSQEFLRYGIFVDMGTGREVPRGNPGDIGRDKKRRKKPWFSKKYYASTMNLRDFFCESIGLDFINFTSNALEKKDRQQL